jgi:hypothetical protein
VRNTRLALLVIVGISLAAVLRAASPEGAAVRREVTLGVPDPAHGALVIGHRGATPARIRFVSLNERRFLHSLADIQADVDAITPAPEHPTPAARVFRFVTENRRHDWYLTANWDWFLSPPLFFNSSGVALCGEAASLTFFGVRDRGLPARLYGLSGHVVVEVWEDGRWKMFDADYGVFFLNRSGEIASVAELEQDGSLITDPVLSMETPGPYSPYTEGYARLFTTLDNFPMPDPAETIDPGPLELDLPPHARIVFPARFSLPPPDWYFDPPFANLKLVLPQGFAGSVRVPLILYAARGSGAVLFEGATFEVGSPELQARIGERNGPGHELQVLEARTSLELVYLFNAVRWPLGTQNRLAFDVLSGGTPWVGTARLGDPAADSDGDGIPDDGDASTVVGDAPCADGVTVGCDDNCSFVFNAAQLDGDGDRAGNACDADLGGDGFVNHDDLNRLLDCEGQGSVPAGCEGADLDEDGVVGPDDVEIFARWEGKEPSPHEEIQEHPEPVQTLAPRRKSHCGLGFELIGLAWLLPRVRSRRYARRGLPT